MFSKNYYPAITRTQSDAVVHIKGSEINATGSHIEAMNAMDYFVIEITGGIGLNTITTRPNVYDEETVQQFLDEGHVLYISRGEN